MQLILKQGYSRNQGFTLIELMIVVAIIGIMAAFAYPSYQNSVKKSRRTDAMGVLVQFSTAMERRYFTSGSYTGAATSNGVPTIFATEAPLEGSKKYYDLTVQAASATSFTLRATPKTTSAQKGDGYLEISSSGQKSWDKNNNNTIDSGENSWDQ